MILSLPSEIRGRGEPTCHLSMLERRCTRGTFCPDVPRLGATKRQRSSTRPRTKGDSKWPTVEGQGEYLAVVERTEVLLASCFTFFSGSDTGSKDQNITLAFDSVMKSNDPGATEPQVFGGRVADRANSPLDVLFSGCQGCEQQPNRTLAWSLECAAPRVPNSDRMIPKEFEI